MNTGNESPQSLSIVGYYKGFSVTLTKRDSEAKIKPLIDDAVEAIDYMIGQSFLPSWNKDTNDASLNKQPSTVNSGAQNTNLGNCPKCSAPMLMSKKGNAYCSEKCWI